MQVNTPGVRHLLFKSRFLNRERIFIMTEFSKNGSLANAGEDIALLRAMATTASNCVWLKKTPNGFSDRECNNFNVVEGTIVQFSPYAIQWKNSTPIKEALNPDGTPPEGFDRAIDLTIKGADVTFGLSIENQTGVNNFARYAQTLLKKGAVLSNVVTRLRVKQHQGKFGTYHAIDFEFVRAADSPKPQEENAAIETSMDETLPF